MARVVLWPRHEVLQLVLPILNNCGNLITNKIVLETAKKIISVENDDHFISFEQWVEISSEYLKWNDSTAQLFWDILHSAVWYKVQHTNSTKNGQLVRSDYLMLFLSLHIADTPAKTAISSYDSVWPAQAVVPETEISPSHAAKSPHGADKRPVPLSVVPHALFEDEVRSPPMSPTSLARKQLNSKTSPIRSPLSLNLSIGNVPTIASSARPSSPKKNVYSYKQSAAHFLSMIRQRLPVILCALALRKGSAGLDLKNLPSLEEKLIGMHVTTEDIDCVGLLIGGGLNRDEEVPKLSKLNGDWDNDAINIPVTDVLSFVEGRLCVNELLYPVSLSHGSSTSSTNASMVEGDINVSCNTNFLSPVPSPMHSSSINTSNHISPSSPHASPTTSPNSRHHPPDYFKFPDSAFQVSSPSHGTHSVVLVSSKLLPHSGPVRVILPITCLSVCRPTVIAGSALLVIHVMAVHCSGRFRSRSLSNCSSFSSFQDTLVAAVKSTGDLCLDDVNSIRSLQDSEMTADSKDADSQSIMNEKVEEFISKCRAKSTTETLPHLIIQSCSKGSALYLLSPYSTGCIVNCSDTEIVIGAVSGVVTITDCERLRVTVAARKIILRNCLDCAISCATLTPVIVSGDSRGITLAPYNCSYRDLSVHMELADLSQLLKSSYRRHSWSRSRNALSTATTNTTTEEEVVATNGRKQGGKTPMSSIGSLGNTKEMWRVIWDVALCIEPTFNASSVDALGRSEGSIRPSGMDYALSGGQHVLMPCPPDSIVSILPVDKFRACCIPEITQHQLYDCCPVDIHRAYVQSYYSSMVSVKTLAGCVASELSMPPPPSPIRTFSDEAPPLPQSLESDGKEAGDFSSPDIRILSGITPTLGSTLMTSKFMDWLVATGKAGQLLDLIRMDSQMHTQQHTSQGEKNKL